MRKVLLILLGVFVFYWIVQMLMVLILFNDPGNNRMYNVPIPNEVERITTSQISQNEFSLLVQFVSDSIVKREEQAFVYNPYTGAKIGVAMDTLLICHVNYVLRGDENKKIYFVSYLYSKYQVGDRYVESKMLDTNISSCAIFLNSSTNHIKDISFFPFNYAYNNILTGERTVDALEEKCIKYALGGNKFYSFNLGILRIRNKNFWSDIEDH
jgi:hypothetical protein